MREKAKIKTVAEEKLLGYISRTINSWLEKEEDVEVVLRRIINLARKFGKFKNGLEERINKVEAILLEHSQGISLLGRIRDNMSLECRHKFLTNFLFRASVVKPDGFYEYKEKYGIQPPYVILISPTMRCNLRCVGCYAGEYSRKDDLDFDVVNKIINEGESFGTSFFTILGGEPFFWKHLFEMFALHPDVYFQVYTNGTLIGEKEAKRLQKLGNVAVMFSLEGFKGLTDERRNKGVFDKVMKAMDLLKKYRVGFGYSCCVTRHNVKEVLSNEFIDLMIEKGAIVGWYFLYMPVGRGATPDLMPTPEQRLYMMKRREDIRENKPLFIIDFWNDAPYVGGCIAGGRHFCHINHRGDVEPCIFIHLATDNIKETSLAEAINSPFFRAMRAKQPFSGNLLLPCQIIDHPEILKSLYETYHPYSTCSGAEEIVTKLHPCLVKYGRKVSQLYKAAWEDWKKIHKEKEKRKEKKKEVI